MSQLSELESKLLSHGVYPYGSLELEIFEERITRFFNREYKRRLADNIQFNDTGATFDQGPMWSKTDDLMEKQYDQDLRLFEAFLDKKILAYSAAYYGEDSESVKSSKLSLENAQDAKYKLICDRAEINGSENILNIGCGFGSFESYLLPHYEDVNISSITVSKVQAGFIRNCMNELDHPLNNDRLNLIEADFGAIDPSELGEESYDLVTGIASFEAVNNLQSAFKKIAGLLRPGGKFFLHLIVSKPVIPQFLSAESTITNRYFPGGRNWPSHIIESQTDYFNLENNWFVNGVNYWKTLDEWQRRYWLNMPKLFGTVLDLDSAKHWNEYFSIFKACFEAMDGAQVGLGHYLFRKS
jgi:cyclopropane-fatty-acyl-phospholipid synthase